MEAAPNREHIRNMAEARAHVKRDGGCYIRPSNCPDPSRCHAPMQTGAVIPQLAESQNLQQSPRPFGRVVHPDETIGKIGPTPVFGPPASHPGSSPVGALPPVDSSPSSPSAGLRLDPSSSRNAISFALLTWSAASTPAGDHA